MIIPSIDLMKGKAVQLEQGERLQIEVDNAAELARNFGRYGEVAIVDLDGARGEGDNAGLMAELCRLAPCRIGGGIRTVEAARSWMAKGAQKIVIASAAFTPQGVNHEFLKKMSQTIGRTQLVIAIDVRGTQVQSHGWRQSTHLSAQAVLAELTPYCAEFLYTAVDYEGLMNGIDRAGLQGLLKQTDNRLIYAGGVSCLDEISDLTSLGADVQLGMALYSGRISLQEAFLCGLKWTESGLIPTLALDQAGRLLMQAWCDRDSLRKTIETGWMTYYSRRRQALWQKGETSGNKQGWKSFRPDCDSDALAVVIEPLGPACHTGQDSCFGPLPMDWDGLYRVICDRLTKAPPGSYTASLNESAAREKIMEEAQEVCEAQGEAEIVWEVADLLYFCTVLMAQAQVTPQQIWQELQRRRRK